MTELQLQCAWCRRQYDQAGRRGDVPATLLPDASHGLCPMCLSALLKKESERWANAGDRVRAFRIERQRLRHVGDLARQRRESIASRVGALNRRSLAIIARS